jgi:hypothetical protein
MNEMRWTRWAAPGGRGYGAVSWIAIVVGATSAGVIFKLVSPWWLGLLAAGIGWLVATGLVGGIWALVRRMIEWHEGI